MWRKSRYKFHHLSLTDPSTDILLMQIGNIIVYASASKILILRLANYAFVGL
jgi:hypothetical protein